MCNNDISDDILFEIHVNDNAFDKFVKDMIQRTDLLDETICMNCNHKGLEAISLNESICNNCKAIHNL